MSTVRTLIDGREWGPIDISAEILIDNYTFSESGLFRFMIQFGIDSATIADRLESAANTITCSFTKENTLGAVAFNRQGMLFYEAKDMTLFTDIGSVKRRLQLTFLSKPIRITSGDEINFYGLSSGSADTALHGLTTIIDVLAVNATEIGSATPISLTNIINVIKKYVKR